MLELQRELDLTRDTTDTLRAQAHEFSNRMHVVSGLIELGEYDEVRALRPADRRGPRPELTAQRDLARRRSRGGGPADRQVEPGRSSGGVELRARAETAGSTASTSGLATDVNTVLGNLVDNALDACRRRPRPGRRRRGACEDEDEVRITVRDSGPGVDRDLRPAGLPPRLQHQGGADPATGAASGSRWCG